MIFIKNIKGFSLTEVVLVISLVSILAIVAMPDSDGLGRMNLDAAARKVNADLRYTQTMATTTQEPFGFRVTGNTTYEIYDVNTGNIATDQLSNQLLQFDLNTDYKGASFNLTTYQIEFDLMGTPTMGGGTSIFIVSGSDQKEIQISSTSGYISLVQ